MERTHLNLEKNIPSELSYIIKNSSIKKIRIGRSFSNVYYIYNSKLTNNCYLKTLKSVYETPLYFEMHNLELLKDILPVPKVLFYQKIDGYEYLLTNEIKGANASEEVFKSDPRKTVSLLANGLRSIHNIDIKYYNFKIQRAACSRNILNNRFYNAIKDKSGDSRLSIIKRFQNIVEYLNSYSPLEDDMVLTHGDYCLPNVIIYKNHINGLIDLGNSAIADRYQDLALIKKSLKYNGYSDSAIKLFFKEYGCSDVDEKKLHYYCFLNEKFYNI